MSIKQVVKPPLVFTLCMRFIALLSVMENLDIINNNVMKT
jgi:hypothetical protein